LAADQLPNLQETLYTSGSLVQFSGLIIIVEPVMFRYTDVVCLCHWTDIPRSMWRLVCNSVYVVTCLGACMELIIVSGFVVFLPKYLETQFSLGKSQASVFTGEQHFCLCVCVYFSLTLF